MSTIVLASNNAGKVKEFQSLLGGLGLNIKPQAHFALDSVEETGLTFVENALLKARHASAHTGLPALADDSGIEVDALKGAPSIYSARFAGPNATDADNNQKLIQSLETVPEQERTARYQCLLVYLRHAKDPTPIICQGTWEGSICLSPQGDGGFGYDPLFWLAEHNCTAAELPKAEKNAISHRGKALQQLLHALTDALKP